MLRAATQPSSTSSTASDPIEALRKKAQEERRQSKSMSRPGAVLPNATQFEGPDNRGKRDIVIGLDFGTSSTKVVIQDPETRDAWAVPFEGSGLLENSYLLPSRISIDKDGFGSFGDDKSIAELKIRLMTAPDEPIEDTRSQESPPTASQLCVLYLALVLQQVRGWFLRTKGDAYRTFQLVWQLNIGIPSNALD